MSATPKVGTDVRLRVGKADDIYRTKVVEMDTNSLFIDIPIHVRTKRELQVQVDSTFVLEYATSENEIYRYTATVEGLAYVPTPAIRIIHPTKAEDLERIQRREFFRASLGTPVLLIKRGSNQKSQAVAVDIGGGGMAIRTAAPAAIEVDELFDVSLKLPYIDYDLATLCRVVRTEIQEDGEQIISFAFEGISERERQQIVRYTFMKQRAMKR